MKPILAFILFLCSTLSALAEARVALVIGNAAYTAAPPLKNPANDAQAMAAALERLGFQVFLGTDLDITAMRTQLRDFSRAAEGADLALFFYAGHGLQVAGRNYLIPVDAELARESDLDFAAIELELVLKQLELASGASIILLDACRDNPFETKLSRAMGAARSGALGRGLAPVETLGGAMIGFATDPGEVAYDGDGTNSPFTEALLTHIETPGLEINALMTRVRADVVTRTGRLQRPWSTSSLLDEVFLAAAPAPQPDPVLADVEAWKAADQQNTPESLAAYLQDFPEGLFAELARARLASLTPVAGTDLPEPQPEPEPEPQPQPDPDPQPIARTDTPPDLSHATDCPLCPALVALPGGPFTLGSASSPEEGPPTTVTLPPFRLSVTEVTVGDYRRFLAASGYTPAPGCYIWTAEGKMRQRKAAGWADPGLPATDNMPVTCVNWQDATAYAAWLAVDTGLDVRLPSEAELEYAIRAGSSDNSAPSPEQACATINAADAASRFGWRNRACEDGFPDLASADAVEPNAFGVKGALGNLWEWTADCWSPSHRGAQPDGTARTGTCDSRTLRGGSWDDPLQNLRPSYRVGIPATRRQANVGFRIAIAP